MTSNVQSFHYLKCHERLLVKIFSSYLIGARGRNRTGTPISVATDFKSVVSTYFTTRANFLLCHSITKNQFIVNLFILVPAEGIEPSQER